MNISVHSGVQTVWSNTATTSPEEQAFKQLVTRCFVPAVRWGAWLLYRKKNGVGLSVVVGPLRPQRDKLKRLYTQVAVAAVEEKWQPLLATAGPTALRWNGTRLVANGN